MENKRFDLEKIGSILLVILLVFGALPIVAISGVNAEIGTEENSVENYIVWGTLVDKYGVPVDTAIVVAVNMDTGNSTWVYGENGTYSLDLAEINGSVSVGDEIKLIASNGICISNFTFTVEGNSSKRIDFVLDPEEPVSPEIGNPFNPDNPFEHNSSSPEMVMPEYKPDMIITELSFSDDRPIQGDIVTLTATVSTAGMFVESFSVAFYIDQKDNERYIASKTITPSPLEITQDVSVIWNTDNVEGNHVIYAVVDPDNVIDESNETNNEISKEICVLTVEFLTNDLKGETNINKNNNDWSEDIRLMHTPGDAVFPKIVASGNTAHVIWINWSDNELHYIRSDDSGLTWRQEMKLSSANSSIGSADIACSGSNVYVIWDDLRNGGYYEICYKISPDGGRTWTDDIQFTIPDTYNSDAPLIGVNGSNLHVVWTDHRDGNREIYYKNSTDNGETWGSEQRLTNYASGSDKTRGIAVDGDNIHVTFVRYVGSWVVYYMHSTDGGITWNNPIPLSDGMDEEGRIAVDGNNVHVIWSEGKDGDGEVYYRNSTDGGDVWNPEIRLTSFPNRDEGMSIAACNGTVFVCWQHDEYGDQSIWDIYYKKSGDLGLSWSNLNQLTYCGYAYNPRVCINNNFTHVVWQDKRSGNREIYYKRSPSFNSPPAINYAYPIENLTIINNQNITFVVNVTDPENDTLTYKWYVNNMLVSENITSYAFSANSTCSGLFEIKVTISDNYSPVNHSWTLTVVNVDALYDNISDLQIQINHLVENLTLAQELMSAYWYSWNLSKENETELQSVIDNLTENLTLAQELVSIYWALWNLSKENETELQSIVNSLTENLTVAQELVSTYWALWNSSKENETTLLNHINQLEQENEKLRNNLNETKKTPTLSSIEIIIILVSLCVIMAIVRKKRNKRRLIK